jgi:hypothetical protein
MRSERPLTRHAEAASARKAQGGGAAVADERRSALAIASRVGAGLLGGYAFVWGFTSLGITLGVAAGMPYVEAQTLLYLLAFLVFVAVFCWAFAAASAARVWGVLAGSGGLMTLGAWLLMRASLSTPL